MGNYWYGTQGNAEIVTDLAITPRKYGWKRDSTSENDEYHVFSVCESQDIIKSVDLRDKFSPVYNQGNLGSCTANAIAAVYIFDMMKQNVSDIFEPSRLFIYYNERKANGTVNEDSGASIRDSVIAISNVGVCPETIWPYNIDNFKELPTNECYDVAQKHKCISYKRVNQNLQQLKQCLIEGFPFVCGIDVYESFESKEALTTGVIPMPQKGEKLLGGHAITFVSFDDTKQRFGFRNSWGETFGEKGYGYLPYDYLTDKNLSADFWTVRIVQ